MMFLTRIGFGAKAVITGDVTQVDLARGQKSGLVDAQQVLEKVSASLLPSSSPRTWCAIRWCRRSSTRMNNVKSSAES